MEGPINFMKCPVGRCMHARTQPCHILLRHIGTTVADLCKASATPPRWFRDCQKSPDNHFPDLSDSLRFKTPKRIQTHRHGILAALLELANRLQNLPIQLGLLAVLYAKRVESVVWVLPQIHSGYSWRPTFRFLCKTELVFFTTQQGH